MWCFWFTFSQFENWCECVGRLSVAWLSQVRKFVQHLSQHLTIFIIHLCFELFVHQTFFWLVLWFSHQFHFWLKRSIKEVDWVWRCWFPDWNMHTFGVKVWERGFTSLGAEDRWFVVCSSKWLKTFATYTEVVGNLIGEGRQKTRTVEDWAFTNCSENMVNHFHLACAANRLRDL